MIVSEDCSIQVPGAVGNQLAVVAFIAITVPDRSLKTSWLRTTTGRVPLAHVHAWGNVSQRLISFLESIT